METDSVPPPEPSQPISTAPEKSAERLREPEKTRHNVMVTGGMGFIGSHLVKALLVEDSRTKVFNVDALTYAAVNGYRFKDTPLAPGPPHLAEKQRHTLISGSVSDQQVMNASLVRYQPRVLYHLAAETHVDRSIDSPQNFVDTNIVGTHVLLEAIRRHSPKTRLLYVSTDEVYGPVPPVGVAGRNREDPALGGFQEHHRFNPRNPYAASKAAAEHLCLAYRNTYGLDVVITRGANTFGPFQHPEKLLPTLVDNAHNDRPLPIYGDGSQTREWLSVFDHVKALMLVAKKAMRGRVFNIAGNGSRTNLQMAKFVLKELEKPDALLTFVEDRPGHDHTYKLLPNEELGAWQQDEPEALLDKQLIGAIHWYASPQGQRWIKEQARYDTMKRQGRIS